MTFAIGSLVTARGREWVVLPDSEPDFLMVRPLGGTDEEVTGIHLGLEEVQPASLAPPNPVDVGDYRSARLLRDAIRLGFRASAGPFRSFGRIACEPRPYQLVPLLLALRLDPVRMLISDDTGIGKTVEACVIARELLDRGEVSRLAVLCPPHLAEQWQRELTEKFAIDAELVLPSTARRLEAPCRLDESLFDIHPFVVVSTDYIKSDRRREEFLRACPELVIVDEAHTCAAPANQRGTRHQRHSLLKGLAGDPDRHLILVTATPHSGNEEAFRSLLLFLDLPGDASLPFFCGLSLGSEDGIPVGQSASGATRLWPIRADRLFGISLGFSSLLGVLDPVGRGSPSLSLPNDPNLAGLLFHASAVTLGPALQVRSITPNVIIYIRH